MNKRQHKKNFKNSQKKYCEEKPFPQLDYICQKCGWNSLDGDGGLELGTTSPTIYGCDGLECYTVYYKCPVCSNNFEYEDGN